jgi:hypothetical protein
VSRRIPNINIDTTQKLRDRLGFKQFVLKVNSDTFIYTYTPNSIDLVESGILITLTLLNKKFIYHKISYCNFGKLNSSLISILEF